MSLSNYNQNKTKKRFLNVQKLNIIKYTSRTRLIIALMSFDLKTQETGFSSGYASCVFSRLTI